MKICGASKAEILMEMTTHTTASWSAAVLCRFRTIGNRPKSARGSAHSKTWRRLGSFLALLPLSASAAPALPAFPGAEGFGANATGGRGGDVYYVTNLEDIGPGSLRHGISSAKGPRSILFKVSGNIKLRDSLIVNKPNITIAGQTAPGDGICFQDYTFGIRANDVIVRHIRTRLGTNARQQDDAFSLNGGTNVIVDHCSASWSVDETLSPAGNAQNLTVQWTYITESLNKSIHSKGPHGYGSLIRVRADASYTFHHDLYAHHSSRNPRPGVYGDYVLRLDFRNNVIYNWGHHAGYDNFVTEHVELNYVNNYLVAGPSTTWFESAFASSGTNTAIYQSGNRFDVNRNGHLNGTNSEWAMFSGALTKEENPFTAPPVWTDPAAAAYERVLALGGALPWRRDRVDARVTADVRNETGKIIDATDEVGGWPELKSEEAPLDSDNDGMSDVWEQAMGLNPRDATHGNKIAASGYTQLEEYLNWLGDLHAVAPRNTATDVNLQTLCGGSTNLSFKVESAANGSVKLSKDGHTARFAPKKDFHGLASFKFLATDSATGITFGPETVRVLVR